ncbi:MAG: hypothetical protein ACTHL8_20960 [Burkholderiaceae bacterium]
MSLIQSSSTTLSSPFATMTATSSKAAHGERAEREGPVQSAAHDAAGAIGAAASATVSFSDKALQALEDAGGYVADAVETGAREVGHAAEFVYDTARQGLGEVVVGAGDAVAAGYKLAKTGIEDAGEEAWKLTKEGVNDAVEVAGDGLKALAKGVGELENLAAEGWNNVTAGVHRMTTAASTIGSDAYTMASKASDIALTVGSTVGSAAGTVLNGVEDVAGTAASYATLGVAAGGKIVSAWI